MIGNVSARVDAKIGQQRSTPKSLRSLLIADDDPRYRQALRAFIEFYRHTNIGWFQDIYEADRGQVCVETAIAQQPDLIHLGTCLKQKYRLLT